MGVREIAATNSRHLWATVSSACSTADVWTNSTTFGPNTVTTGGKAVKPAWANSISGLIHSMVHDHSTTVSGISGVRLRDGVTPSAQYFLGCGWGGQTTVSVSMTVNPVVLNPMLSATGDVGIDVTPGVSTAVGTAVTSIRWDSAPPTTKLYWKAAIANSTAATDLLSNALTAYAGDTTFPVNVPNNCAGIRALSMCQSSDSAAAGSSIGQYRIQGTGLIDNPQDIGGVGHGGEAGATSGFGAPSVYWDEWLGVNPGSQISLVAGYTGADTGGETLGTGMAFQV